MIVKPIDKIFTGTNEHKVAMNTVGLAIRDVVSRKGGRR